MVAEIVRTETRYLRHYIGTVAKNIDPESMRRVLVTIPSLGWDTENVGAWCFPRQGHSLVIPSVGEAVEVYFIEGNLNRPVYLSIATEQTRGIPKIWKSETDDIIFESPKKKNYIKHDDKTGEMDLKAETITLIDPAATEYAVLGTQLNTYLTTLVTAINALFATKLDGGGAAGILTLPSGLLSAKVKLK